MWTSGSEREKQEMHFLSFERWLSKCPKVWVMIDEFFSLGPKVKSPAKDEYRGWESYKS